MSPVTTPHPVTTDAPWTIIRLLNWTRDHFAQLKLDEPRLSAEILLAHALGCQRIDLYRRFEQVPSDEQRACYRELVRRAAGGEPVAYLVGEREFYSLRFKVAPDVLIPRPETELLVEHVLDHCQQSSLTNPLILEPGVGSGCILVSLLKHLPEARGVGVDISPAALDIARQNAVRHGVSERMTLTEADWLSLPRNVVPEGGFDLLVSNPPYIAGQAVAGLAECIRRFEPRIALTDERDGLEFYRRIAADGPAVLKPQGCVFVEVGVGQAEAVREILTAHGVFRHLVTHRDRVGGHERMLQFANGARTT